jgi:photosystem II stability/assembly factor-like uncharacterized protein
MTAEAMMVACLSPNGSTAHDGAGPALRLYVGSRTGIGILVRAAPGTPWRLAARALAGRHISAMMADPAGRWVAAGCHDGGFYLSADAGRTWERRSDGLSIEHVFSLAQAGRADRPSFYLGTQPVSLFRSDDLGRSWRELPSIGRVPGTEKWSFPDPANSSHTKCIAVDRRDPAVLYVAVEQGGLFRSADGGATWRELDSYSRPGDLWYHDIHRIVQVAPQPDRFYMTSGTGLYASEDGGETWEHLTDPAFRVGYPDHFVVSPLDPMVVFMSGARLDPTTWRRSHYADSTVVRSHDGGRSWTDVGRGLPDERRANIEAMSIASYPGGFDLFAGNTDGEVFASANGGESWARIADGLGAITKLGHFRLVTAMAAK